MTALSDWKSNNVTCISGATAQIRMMIVTPAMGTVLVYCLLPLLFFISLFIVHLPLSRTLRYNSHKKPSAL